MATFVRPADAYRARHRAPPGDAERALADLSLRDEGVASASLGGLPDDLWRRICAFVRPASAHELIVAAGSSASLRHALCAEVAQTERSLFGIYAEMGGEGSEGGPKLAEVLFPIQDRICEGLRNWKP